jgi:hypothetical protein
MKGARMNKLANLLRVVAFLLCTLISAGVFGGFAVWAVSTLDPATQEVIGLLNSPWVAAPKNAKLGLEAATVVNREDGSTRSGSARRP